MEFFVQQWEALMQDAQNANSQSKYEHSLELNHSALAVSKYNYPKLFDEQPNRATHDVLRSYFSTIDACIALSEFDEAQEQFEDALIFLRTSSGQIGINDTQYSATLNGISKLYFKWCEFIHHHRNQIPENQRKEFQQSITRFTNLRKQSATLH